MILLSEFLNSAKGITSTFRCFDRLTGFHFKNPLLFTSALNTTNLYLILSPGFEEGMAQRYSYYGQGTGPIYMQSFSCEGTESDLLTCLNSGFNHSWSHYDLYSCPSHRRDASVHCYNTTFSKYTFIMALHWRFFLFGVRLIRLKVVFF